MEDWILEKASAHTARAFGLTWSSQPLDSGSSAPTSCRQAELWNPVPPLGTTSHAGVSNAPMSPRSLASDVFRPASALASCTNEIPLHHRVQRGRWAVKGIDELATFG